MEQKHGVHVARPRTGGGESVRCLRSQSDHPAVTEPTCGCQEEMVALDALLAPAVSAVHARVIACLGGA